MTVLEKGAIDIYGRGGRASYLRKSGNEEVPLVMLPGWPFGSVMFGEVMAMATPTETMIGVDYPGWGESNFERELDLKSLSLFVNGLVSVLEVPRVDLLGVSFGAAVAATYTTMFPDKVRSLVLNALPVRYSDHLTLSQKFLLLVIERAPVVIPAIREMVDMGSPAVWAAIVRSAPIIEDEFDQQVFDQVRAADTRALVETVRTVSQADLRDTLPKIRAATLLMVGQDDFLAADSLTAATKIPGSRLVYISGSHSAIRDYPEEFLGEVRKFRNRVGGKIGVGSIGEDDERG